MASLVGGHRLGVAKRTKVVPVKLTHQYTMVDDLAHALFQSLQFIYTDVVTKNKVTLSVVSMSLSRLLRSHHCVSVYIRSSMA